MSGIDRRGFMLSAGASALSAALPSVPQAAPRKVKGVIWIWLGGGMGQTDTFDPKPGHPNGGEFKAIDTSVKGIQVTEHLRRCADQMRHLCLIRSMSTHEGSHERGTFIMHTGRRFDRAYEVPSIGTILAFELGPKNFPLPRHLVIDPPPLPQASPFGDEYRPFLMRYSENPIPNLKPAAGPALEKDRAALLRGQNLDWDAGRRQEEVLRIEEAYRASDAMMASPQREAFNLEQEPAELRARYGDRFGLNCLLARRLVQAGFPFVEIGMGGWDMHADVFGNLKRMLPALDAGFGTLIEDLAARNLLQDVLVVLATEFGRTPSINAGKGRDRHADGFTVVLAGGGLKGGRVHGDTGPDGMACREPVRPADLFATLYKACGVDETKTYDAGGRSFRYIEGGTPIAGLF